MRIVLLMAFILSGCKAFVPEVNVQSTPPADRCPIYHAGIK